MELCIPDFIGFAGVGITLVAYFLLQLGFFKIEDITYSVINALGALLILTSLHFSWNSASVAIEVCWFFISVYGIYKTGFAGKKNPFIKKDQTEN